MNSGISLDAGQGVKKSNTQQNYEQIVDTNNNVSRVDNDQNKRPSI